jgi:hypothetical protein
MKAALDFKPVGARGLRDLFNFMEEALGDLARAAAGLPPPDRESRESRWLAETVARWQIRPPAVAEAMARVDDARDMASGNVNPQLVVFGLLHELRRDLLGPGKTTDHRKTHGS